MVRWARATSSAGLAAQGWTCATSRVSPFAHQSAREATRTDEGASQKELDLGIAAAKLVLSPPGDCVAYCRIEPDQKGSTLRDLIDDLIGRATQPFRICCSLVFPLEGLFEEMH
jgi:hypothetical protein